jgi:hypothetical protein
MKTKVRTSVNGDIGTETQYDYLYNGIANKYPAVNADGVTSVFQFTGGPMQANWGNGSTDLNAYNFANSGSASLDGFYTQTSQLFNSYKTYISSLYSPAFINNTAYTTCQQSITDVINQQQQISTQLSIGYATYCKTAGATPESQTAWYNDIEGGLNLYNQYNQFETQLNALTAQLAGIIAELDGPLSDAINACDPTKSPAFFSTYSNVTQTSSNATITIEGNLATDKARWDGYADSYFDLDVTITGSTEIVNPWKKLYSASVTQNCFTTSTNASFDVSRIIQDESYKLEVKCKGLTSYNITLGGWYNETFVNPSIAVFPPGSLFNSDSFFGLAGSLHLIPSQVWVMYKPCISLTVTTETYKQQFTGEAVANIDWLNIFGASFDFTAGASMEPVDNGDNTTTITFDSPGTSIPQVLGVMSNVKYNGNV